VKDVIGCSWQMCCNICIIWWFRLKKATVCVQEKHKAVWIVVWALGLVLGLADQNFKRTKDTTYPVGTLRFCLHAASLEILQQIS
jgi:hypothetical protein